MPKYELEIYMICPNWNLYDNVNFLAYIMSNKKPFLEYLKEVFKEVTVQKNTRR